MSGETSNVFDLLAKPVKKLVKLRGFSAPTPPQEKAIPKILEGKNILLISPTASGKTEAAFLPVLSMLIQMPEKPPGIKALYITPLRALNRDMLERFEWWCMHLDLKLAVRHGDTEKRERFKQAKNPPDILITTPETLQVLLTGRILRRHLRSVRWIIVDEVHEMADSKRGSQLSLGLERLRSITEVEPQIIGLSATIGSPDKVAKFLVGNGREVEVIKVPVVRFMKIKVIFPQPESEDNELASMLYTHPEVAARLRIIMDLIEKHNSALVFTNTRSISEVLASRFKVWNIDYPLSIHHGSLSKVSRITAERGLKNGELKALVCTSSLELGIDVGRIDLVIQYMSPRQATRLVQRIGRSGHRIGKVAKGVIITMDSDDTLEALVIARKAMAEELEPVKIPECPLDALAHQIAGLLIWRKRWNIKDIYELFRKAYPYRNLTIEDILKVVSYMHERFPRLAWMSKEDMIILKPKRSKSLFEYYFNHLSMIPDEKQYLVVEEETGKPIGILDEAFVAEYGRPGVKFIIRGSPWTIVNLSRDRIYVRSVNDPTGAIPSWVGEEIPVPFEVAREVGFIRRFVEKKVKSGMSSEDIAEELSRKYPGDSKTILRAISETVEHVKFGFISPTDKRIVLEEWEDYIIMHMHFGSLTNRSIAQLIGYRLTEKLGIAIQIQHDPYRIMIQAKGLCTTKDIIEILKQYAEMRPDSISKLLKKATINTGLFKRRMIHVAQRFGAISKWADLSSINLKSLIKSFEGTAIYEEAVKETLTKDLDLENTLKVFSEIKRGEIEITVINNGGTLSPLAKLGIDRMAMKTDLIPPKRMKRILIKAVEARLMNEARVFVCTECWNYIEIIRIKDLPDKPTCPRCGSNFLGLLDVEENKVYSLIEKSGRKLTKSEEKLKRKALKTARLISVYGKAAALALVGRKLKPSDAEWVLSQESKVTSRFFELILEAERKAMAGRPRL